MREWRPGDVVLVNAGWVYTPLAAYWDDGESAEWAAPPLGRMIRLLPKEMSAATTNEGLSVHVVRSGSVDGDESLGWGAADADFFAATTAETLEALDSLAANPAVQRIWQYRMYDTVSDPDGAVREWLDANTTLLRGESIPGRDFGMLELREVEGREGVAVAVDPPIAHFGDEIALQGIDTARADSAAGTTFYATLHLLPTAENAAMPPLAASLRLLDSAGNQTAQHDQAVVSTVPPLAVASGGVPPGEYTLTLLLYDPATGTALPVVTGWESIDGQQIVVGRYRVE
jgi:hypothetical protein